MKTFTCIILLAFLALPVLSQQALFNKTYINSPDHYLGVASIEWSPNRYLMVGNKGPTGSATTQFLWTDSMGKTVADYPVLGNPALSQFAINAIKTQNQKLILASVGVDFFELRKVDSAGSTIWGKNFVHLPINDSSFVTYSDSRLYELENGHILAISRWHVLITLLDSNGTTLWMDTTIDPLFTDAVPLNDGTIMLVGMERTGSTADPDFGAIILKRINLLGDSIWQKNYPYDSIGGNPFFRFDHVTMAQLSNGNFVVCAGHPIVDAYQSRLIIIDSSGNVIMNDPNWAPDPATDILDLGQGEFAISTAGCWYDLTSPAWGCSISVRKHNAIGNRQWFYIGGDEMQSVGNPMAKAGDQGILITSYTEKYMSTDPIYARFVKLDTAGNTTVSIQKPIDDSAINIYPNPVSELITIETEAPIKGYSILNSQGQILREEEFSEHQVPVSELSPGYYILKIQSSNAEEVIPFIKE